MKSGDNVLFYYKGKAYVGVITTINLQLENIIIYNVKCGNDEYELQKDKLTGEITETIKL